MKARLMFPDRDFDLPSPSARQGSGWDWDFDQRLRRHVMGPDRRGDGQPEWPPHERALIQDLELDTLLRAMAGDDDFLVEVARHAILSGVQNDAKRVLYRQEVVRDCLKNTAVVRELYTLAVEAIEQKRKSHIGMLTRYPGSTLYSSKALKMLMGMLKRLKDLADAHASVFESEAFTALFATLREEFSDEYFRQVQKHLSDLKFRQGLLMSAQLGKGNEGTNYVLRQPNEDERSWLDRLLGKSGTGYTFYIHERDEAGARAVSELRDRGINLVANALAQSTDHILSFFDMLRTELAFYVGCLNLRDTLAPLGVPVSFPRPEKVGVRSLRFTGLYDVCLALRMGHSVVGNALDAAGKSLVIITGANQGGKSTFLRSLGLAQLMMQCGMFVPAESFAAGLCPGLFTHYKREEDATMTHGKLDEELARMSEIVDAVVPNAIVLFNESFASTNEREGSEIARQVVSALLEKRITVFFVTHLYEFARGMFERNLRDAEFLRAERRADGARTFKVVEGEPLETSYGEDLYKEIFEIQPAALTER